ncbi:MAG TPA: metallophosphoesterase, partial [Polyangia bacterium]|nr:metallophosphoesterase [Polyangia bacterium]
ASADAGGASGGSRASGSGGAPGTGGATATPARADAGADGRTPAAPVVRVVAAGDIACNGCAQSATAGLIDNLISADHLAAVLVLGDLAYSSGSAAEFQSYYAPSWGRPEILGLTHPVPGNHEYASGSAHDYFDYFDGPGGATGPAGPRDKGFYSFDVGAWHVIALNSSDECRFVSCTQTSEQHDWLVADLAAHPSACTLAFWHHPRFQAGTSAGELTAAAPLWNALYEAGVDVVLNGHEHGYQQLSPLDEAGQLDVAAGIRTFVVGTGGGEFDTTFGGPRLGALETSLTGSYGVLELTLSPSSYQWQFLATDGSKPAAASGSASCH